MVRRETIIACLDGVLVAAKHINNVFAVDEHKLALMLLQLRQLLPVRLKFFFECHNPPPSGQIVKPFTSRLQPLAAGIVFQRLDPTPARLVPPVLPATQARRKLPP